MAAPRRTQKQIAERYKGNLGYYNKKHPWRRARRWVSFVAIVGGFTSIVLFQMHGHEKFFNAGKISSNHAAFGDNCVKCHDKSLMTGGALTLQKFREVVKDRFRNGISFEPIDQRCETCHQLHALQTKLHHWPRSPETKRCCRRKAGTPALPFRRWTLDAER